MPHFKCVRCKTRLYGAGGPVDLVGDLCPDCGSLLEPVGELTEIVGFRSIRPRNSAAGDSPPHRRQRMADQLDGLFARREAIRSQGPFDDGRWVDDGGSAGPEAVAEAIALPTPEENP
jgi:hypothetical protein